MPKSKIKRFDDIFPGSSGKAFSLYYNELARWLFITMAFMGLLSTGWFGIPLAPRYLVDNSIDIIAGLFTLFSALGTIWGVMAYRELTRSSELMIETRHIARKLDPMMGEYEYKSYNPESREYEEGYIPMGPVDFWDKETHVPFWLDKGKYWHILLGLQSTNREVLLQVVKDDDLPFGKGSRNVAVTTKELLPKIGNPGSKKRYRYRVKIPQWLVMNTERARFEQQKERLQLANFALSEIITELNNKLVRAADEVVERERPRVQYPWAITALAVYINKSLPLRIIYKEVLRQFPGAKKHIVEDINSNLANTKDDDLIAAVIDTASKKGISTDRLENIGSLIKFLKNAYNKQGLGEGSSDYHNFHHSLEVTYMCLQMLPKEFRNFQFGAREYEIMVVAGLLHDYDPLQTSTEANNKSGPKGPKVIRTIQEIKTSRIHDAFFTMDGLEFENYFKYYYSNLLPPFEFSTTHPEHVKIEWSTTESLIVEALIWHTDFPFHKQEMAMRKFAALIDQLSKQGVDKGMITTMGEILWLADLAVTYMGSDPIRAWDRVTNLYDELYLPRVEAVTRTDAFFSDFADEDLFKEIISTKQFPEIFRQRWSLIYQFFHEGNPSTQVNRIIEKARILYLKINIELNMRRGDLLQVIASNNWGEYFIGIGSDQLEVLKAKSRIADLDPQNASVFWGDSVKLLPNILSNSIDNFLIVLPQNSPFLLSTDSKVSFSKLLSNLPDKLTYIGTLQILTDMEKEGTKFKELIELMIESGFYLSTSTVFKTYFPSNWTDPDFKKDSKPTVYFFKAKR